MRILIVDDNEELREFMALSLAEAGLDTVAVACEEALAKVEAEKFDVLVIDSVMNNGDGIELTQQIRATRNGRSIPILLMSSISTALARRMAKSVGASEFLVKPFGQMQLIEQVKSLKS